MQPASNMKLLIFGPQLSGKGTQADFIAAEYGLVHVTAGGILREMYSKGNAAVKKKLDPFVNKGKLLPDKEMDVIIGKYLDSILKMKKGFVLEGYPRTMPQVKFLEGYFLQKKTRIDCALLIDISDAEIMKRLDYRLKTESRKDDADPSALKKRLGLYKKKTVPVIKHYEKKGILIKINGQQTREEVFEDIKSVLSKFTREKSA